jgi:hypothetical protein
MDTEVSWERLKELLVVSYGDEAGSEEQRWQWKERFFGAVGGWMQQKGSRFSDLPPEGRDYHRLGFRRHRSTCHSIRETGCQ